MSRDWRYYNWLELHGNTCPICEDQVEMVLAMLPVQVPSDDRAYLDTQKPPRIRICPKCRYWEPCDRVGTTLRAHQGAVAYEEEGVRRDEEYERLKKEQEEEETNGQ